jgi:hypothetical protein
MSYEFIDTAALALTPGPLDPALGAMLGNDVAGGAQFLDPQRLATMSSGGTGEILVPADDPVLPDSDPMFSEGGDDDSGEPIVVTGRKLTNDSSTGGATGGTVYYSENYTFTLSEPPLDSDSSNDSDVTVVPAPADELVIEIRINVDPLTPEQEAVVQKFKTAVQDATKAIRGLADDERIQMSDGSVITGKELKELWAKTDFVINPDTKLYDNGTTRGEAAYNDGNPQISFNIGTVDGYEDSGAAGLNFMVLHELGHLTAANRAFDANTSNPQSAVEQMANDIARAIAYDANIPILGPGPAITYGTQTPLVFETPTGDGGGGGGWGGEYDQPI